MLELASAQWLGSVPTWALFVLALAVAWRVSRGGGGSAVSELSKANEVLTSALQKEREQREALGGEVRDLKVRNAELEGRTDFAAALTTALEPLREWTENAHERHAEALVPVIDAVHAHEDRAQERHRAELAALERIANGD